MQHTHLAGAVRPEFPRRHSTVREACSLQGFFVQATRARRAHTDRYGEEYLTHTGSAPRSHARGT